MIAARARLRRIPRGAAGLAVLLVAGLIVRLAALVSPGYGSDLNVLTHWATDVVRHGIGGYYAAGGGANYPPALYVLWALDRLLRGHDIALGLKALSIPFDLLTAILLYRMTARHGVTTGWWAAGLYLLNPITILAGAAWGQLDVLGALPMVAAIWALGSRRYALAGALAAIAALVKTQFGIALALLAFAVLLELRERRIRPILEAGLGVAVAAVVVLAPLRLSPLAYLDLLARFYAVQPVASAGALNLWAAVDGFGTPDAAYVGLATVAFAVIAVGTLGLLLVRRDLPALLAVGSLVALASYLVLTRVHERYIFGAIVLMAPVAALHPRARLPTIAISILGGIAIGVDLLGGLANRQLAIDLNPSLWLIRVGVVAMVFAAARYAWVLRSLLIETRSPAGTLGPSPQGRATI